MEQLSPRLQAIASLVIPGKSMADIGSDHAQLPLYLIENDLVPYAVAGELGDGPYRRALAAARSHRLGDRIEVRQGDGIQPLAVGETATVVIAGLGGESIAEILAYDWCKSESFEKFILQPMTRPAVLRRTLAQRGWPILEEKLLLDRDRFVVIIVSQPGSTPYSLDSLEAEIGGEALKADDTVKREYLYQFAEKYTKIYASLNYANRRDTQQLAVACREKLERLERILNGSYRRGY